MNIESFWEIIDSAKGERGVDFEDRIPSLTRALENLSAAELQSFQDWYDKQIVRSYRRDLCAAACIINGGCSDDGFRYFRDWLISEGREVFEGALKDPETLADLPRFDFAELEAFGYVALSLYKAMGIGELDRDFSTEISAPSGEPWEEDQLENLLPRLSRKYSI